MRLLTLLPTLMIALCLQLQAQGFEVSTPDQALELEGQTVYPFVTACIDKSKDVYVFAGEPLQAIAFERRDSGEPILSHLKVSSADGREGTIPLDKLSKLPLGFNLLQPGKPDELIVKLVDAALPVAEAWLAVQRKHGYRVPSYRQNSYGNSVPTDDSFQVETRMAYLKSLEWTVRALVRGFSRREYIVKDPQYQWAVKATDANLLNWFCAGIPDKDTQRRYEDACSALGSLNNLSELARDAGEQGLADSRRAELEGLLDNCIKSARASRVTLLNAKPEPKRESEAERSARTEKEKAASEKARLAAIAEGQRRVKEELAALQAARATRQGGLATPTDSGASSTDGGSGIGSYLTGLGVLLLAGLGGLYLHRRRTRSLPAIPAAEVPAEEAPAELVPAIVEAESAPTQSEAREAMDEELVTQRVTEAKPVVIAMIKEGRISRENGQKALAIYRHALRQGKRVSIERVIEIKKLTFSEQPVGS